MAVELEGYAVTSLGQTYENKYVVIFEVSEGKIRDVREYNDSLHVMQVLLPAMEHAAKQKLG